MLSKVLKSILLICFLGSGIYFMGTGAMWSLGGFVGWIAVSVMVAIIVAVALSPILLVVWVIGRVLGI
jgi:hypothetical protein